MNSYFNPGYQSQILNNPSNHLIQFLKRPVILVIAVLTFLSALVAAICAVISLLTTDITTVTRTYDGTTTQYDLTPIVEFIGAAVTALIGVACLRINLQAKKGEAATGSTTILKVFSVIYLVLMSLGTIIYSLCFFIIMGNAKYFERAIEENLKDSLGYMATTDIMGMLSGMIFALLAIILIVLVAATIYYVCAVMFSFRMKKILENRALVASAATGIGVFNIIFAVFTGLAILIYAIAICGVAFGDNSAYASMNGISVSKSENLINMLLVFVSIIIGFILSIAKAVAVFGMKKHMRNYNGPTINQQTPTSYYGDNYSNFDNTTFNQSGFNNTGANNGYNNNSGYPFCR